MKCDITVDIVCAGSGAAGLATAIYAVDYGGDVFVAATPRCDRSGGVGAPFRPQPNHLHHWFGAHVSDLETAQMGHWPFAPDTA